jgi:hypothetical protein
MLCTGNTIFGYSAVTTFFTGIYIEAASHTVTGNSIQYESSNSPAHIGIDIRANYATVSGNQITQYQFTGTGIKRGSGTPDFCVITGNTVTGFDIGVDITSMVNASVTGNTLNVNAGVVATNSSDCIISSNTMISNATSRIGISAINTSTAKRITITGNNISTFGLDGINLTLVTKAVITDNVIINPSQAAANTSDGIIIQGTSTYNVISGNTISRTTGTMRYGIREAAAADGPNTITGNICLDYGTAAISTQNTSTQVGLNITS